MIMIFYAIGFVVMAGLLAYRYHERIDDTAIAAIIFGSVIWPIVAMYYFWAVMAVWFEWFMTPTTALCRSCRAEMSLNARYCPTCGFCVERTPYGPLPSAPPAPPAPSAKESIDVYVQVGDKKYSEFR